jgi:outer membrane protein TolC
MMRRSAIILYALFSTIIASDVYAQDNPPSRQQLEVAHYELPAVTFEGSRVTVELEDSLSRALQRNLGLLVEAVAPRLRYRELVEQRAAFDPEVFAEVTNTDIHEQVETSRRFFIDSDATDSRFLDAETGIRQKWSTGAEVELSGSISRVDFDDNAAAREFDLSALPEDIRPAFEEVFSRFAGGQTRTTEYEAVGTVSLTQPLLKDFGPAVNRKDIKQADNELERARYLLSRAAEGLLYQVELAYWELVFAHQDLRIKNLSLQLARDLLRTNRARQRVGAAPPLDVLDTEANVARREEELIQARNRLRDREDMLRQLLNVPAEDWDTTLLPQDKPVFEPVELEVKAAVRQALLYRPDYQAELLNLSNRRIDVDYTRNQQLPRLDIFGAASVHGLERSPSDAFDTAGDRDFNTLTAGAVFQYPLGNRAARSRHESSRLELEQTELGLQDLELTIRREVREAVRQVLTDSKRVQATRKARVFEERKLFTEQRSYELGLATSVDVLEFQEDLAAAQTSEVRAIIDFRQSLAALSLAQGTLLIDRGLRLADFFPEGVGTEPGELE